MRGEVAAKLVPNAREHVASERAEGEHGSGWGVGGARMAAPAAEEFCSRSHAARPQWPAA